MSWPSTTEAILQERPRSFRLTVVPVSRQLSDNGLLRVEACGICGSDIEQFRGTLAEDLRLPYPFIPGHEPVGIVEDVGDEAARRWGVEPGDRVVVEAGIPCGHCRACVGGETLCSGWSRFPYGYGLVPLSEPWGPSGGYSRLMLLHPHTRLHKVGKTLPLSRVVLFNLLSAGVAWAVHAPDLQLGESVAIWGPGQRGLAALIAAKAAGAGPVIVIGRPQDRHRLAMATAFGADVSITDEENVAAAVMELTRGVGVDVALDASAGATRPVREAISSVRPGGRVVLAGLKGRQNTTQLATDEVVLRGITVKGVFATGTRAVEQAVRLIETSRLPLERLHTHAFALEDAGRAISVLAGETQEASIAVSLRPAGQLSD